MSEPFVRGLFNLKRTWLLWLLAILSVVVEDALSIPWYGQVLLIIPVGALLGFLMFIIYPKRGSDE